MSGSHVQCLLHLLHINKQISPHVIEMTCPLEETENNQFSEWILLTQMKDKVSYL
jgi:hypothetical protein